MASPSFTSNTWDKLLAKRITLWRTCDRLNLISSTASIWNYIVNALNQIWFSNRNVLHTNITSSTFSASFFNNISPTDFDSLSNGGGSGPPYKMFVVLLLLMAAHLLRNSISMKKFDRVWKETDDWTTLEVNCNVWFSEHRTTMKHLDQFQNSKTNIFCFQRWDW